MVDYQVGKGMVWMNLKISENDVLEDHQEDQEEKDVMKVGDKDEDEDKDVDDEIRKNNDDNKGRICHVCKKGFGSGKALGGHMRIHVQGSKKQLLSDEKAEKLKALENYNNDDQLLPTCSMCGKNFPSMKSLFGHMRCHPERAWRGIQPPNLKSNDEIHVKKAKKPASATVTATTDVSNVPGWSVRAKRGRKPGAEEATDSVSKDEEKLQDAVHHLMLLANGDSIESGVTGDQLEKTNSNSLTSKAENEEFHASDESRIIDTTKRKKKKLKLRHLNSVIPASATAVTPEKYKCNTCGKSFATHQALGGHKSSHNKFRMVIQNSDRTNTAAISEEAAASSSKLLADSKLSSQLNSPGEFSHTTTGHRILDFDLNELPPDHHEDELPGNHEYFPFFPI